MQDGKGSQPTRAYGLTSSWRRQRWYPVLPLWCFLMGVSPGRRQVYAPRDETRRGASGDIRPFGADPPRKHHLLRPKSQRQPKSSRQICTGIARSCVYSWTTRYRSRLPHGGVESKLGAEGTGKTHTLIEIIRQLTSVSSVNPKPLRILVCGASNLAVDNVLERLLALPVTKSENRLKITRVGHPARVMSDYNVLDSTLDMKAERSDEVS